MSTWNISDMPRWRYNGLILVGVCGVLFLAYCMIVLPSCGGTALGTRPSLAGFVVVDRGRIEPVSQVVWLLDLHASLLALGIGPLFVSFFAISLLISTRKWKAVFIIPFLALWVVGLGSDTIGGYMRSLLDCLYMK